MSEQLFYTIEEGKVYANATKWFEKRLLTTLPEKNYEATLAFLHEKFEDLDKELTLFLHEYKNASDKLKFAGKINRLKSYYITAKAIGNYNTLVQPLEDLENELKAIVDGNIAERESILKQAEALSAAEGDWKSKTEKLQELAKAMRALPLVPDARVDEYKKKLETLRDEFFSSKSKHFEDQEKVFLDNLAHKIELCEKAEALSASKEWKNTTEEINKLNEQWKAIGPVPRHRSDELWMRFNEAKDKFFASRKEYYGDLKVNQEANLIVKLELIEKAEALKDSRDWKKTTDEFVKLMDEWKKSGAVSLEQKDEVWNKFIGARNHFFEQKDSYYSSIKLNLEDNYARKMALLLRTEELAKMENPDWDSATMEVLEMVDEWKKIGRIPKEYGDEAWERFLKAKKDFFDRKDVERARRRSEGSKVLDEKIKRNRGYYNKLNRELQYEQEILFDFQERLQNLPPSIKSFDTKERYETIIADAEKKVNFLKQKLKDVKNNLDADEKEFRFINRPFKKKEDKAAEESTKEKNSEAGSTEESAENNASPEVNDVNEHPEIIENAKATVAINNEDSNSTGAAVVEAVKSEEATTIDANITESVATTLEPIQDEAPLPIESENIEEAKNAIVFEEAKIQSEEAIVESQTDINEGNKEA
jgi:hypothetical protein